MYEELLARIILLKDGTVHIALNNYKTVKCSKNSLLDLFAEPYSFLKQLYLKYEESTRFVNPKRVELNLLPGLTLAVVQNDTVTVIYYPFVFQKLMDTKDAKIHWNLLEIANQNAFTDSNHYLLKLFLDLGSNTNMDLTIEHNLTISPKRLENIIKELTLSSIHSLYQVPPTARLTVDEQIENAAFFNGVSPEVRMLTVSEYAKLHNLKRGTVDSWIQTNKLHGAIKNERGHWMIHENEPIPIDGRKGRKGKRKPNEQRKNVTLRGNSYEDHQNYIKERKLVTDAVRPFIRYADEAKYYERHNYHEVEWDGHPAMIIDINPEYYCERLQKTNREIIKEGGSPVVPDNDEYTFHLHHIGQQSNSPFAIIPEYDHNGKEYSSVFHPLPSNEKDLHNKDFEIQKRAFWKTYLEYYDRYGYRKIPFLNSKHKKDER